MGFPDSFSWAAQRYLNLPRNSSSVQMWWKFGSHDTKAPFSQKNCQQQPPAVIAMVPILGEQTTNGRSKTTAVRRQQVLAATENNPVILKGIIKTRSHYHSDSWTMTHVKPAYAPSALPKVQVFTDLQLLSRLARCGREPEPHTPTHRLRRSGDGQLQHWKDSLCQQASAYRGQSGKKRAFGFCCN